MDTKKQSLVSENYVGFLFILCWVAYFSTYIGRSNYAASMVEIISAEGFSNSACGLVGTGFFICYGIGQLFSGLVGDYVHPKWMIFIGIIVSSLANFRMSIATTTQTMLIIWCINGIFQSMTWSPIVRIFAEYFPASHIKKACVKMATTYPIGILFTYIFAAFIIRLFNWRIIFSVTAIIMVAISIIWILGFSYIEKYHMEEKKDNTESTDKEIVKINTKLPYALLAMIGVALVIQGALRDGIMTWIPSFLSDTFTIDNTISIFCTIALPIINLLGVQVANYININLGFDEVKTSLTLFAAASVASLCLMIFGRQNIIISIAIFSVMTSAMMGINIMLVSLIPTYFVKWGKVSLVSGILNSMVYVGSSIASFGIGYVTDGWGWGILLVLLFIITIAGTIGSAIIAPIWRSFLQNNYKQVSE